MILFLRRRFHSIHRRAFQRAALQAHIAERNRYPQVDEYHALHQAFLRKEFATR